MTKVGSRRVIQWAAGIMIIQGVLNKFGTVFILIPDPIVGGIFNVMFGMICAFGKLDLIKSFSESLNESFFR